MNLKKKKNEFFKRKPNSQVLNLKIDSDNCIIGKNSVLEALNAGIFVKNLYVSDSIVFDDKIKKIISFSKRAHIDICRCSKIDLNHLTKSTNHQGVALITKEYKYCDPIFLFKKTLSSGKSPLIVALDSITDPRNFGAMMRSIDAFGGHGIIIPERRSVSMTPSVWKTASGSGVRIPVAKTVNLNSTLKNLKKLGAFIVGLDANSGIDLQSFTLHSEPLILVVGSENKGISRLTKEICDCLLSIPTKHTIESLNAGVATSIALYQIFALKEKI